MASSPAGEDPGELHVADEKVAQLRLSSTSRTPIAPFVDEGHGHDRARDVLGLLGEGTPEAGVAGDVGDGERLAGREDVADEAAVGRDLEAHDALALGAGGDAEDQQVAGGVEEGERSGLGLEEEDRRLDDRAEDASPPSSRRRAIRRCMIAASATRAPRWTAPAIAHGRVRQPPAAAQVEAGGR
jgi:hypothetical protein